MAIAIAWGNAAQTIIRLDYGKTWGWQDWYDTEYETVERLNQADQAVDVVLNLNLSEPLPKNIVSHILMLMRHDLPRLNKIYVVGANRALQALINTGARICPENKAKLIFIENESDAHARAL